MNFWTTTESLAQEAAAQDIVLRSQASLLQGSCRLELTEVLDPAAVTDLAVTSLNLDGTSILETLTAPQSHNLSNDPHPGRVTGDGAIAAELTKTLEQNALYLVTYEILEDHQGGSGVFFGASSPFKSVNIDSNVGAHSVLVRAGDVTGSVLLRVSGDITFGAVACRKAEWLCTIPRGSQDKPVTWVISSGRNTHFGRTIVPRPGQIYVAMDGDDAVGTGAKNAPLRQPQTAADKAQPGDVIYLRPGTYNPFSVSQSGAVGDPITFTTLPGEERQAIIQGDLHDHNVNGGPGGSSALSARSGIRIEARDYITIENLTIQDVPYEGIFVLGGDHGTQHGHHRLSGNLIRNTGNAGIFVVGFSGPRQPSESVARTIDVLIEHNDVSQTNVVTDFNQHLTNGGDGSPGGVNEAISVSSSCADIVTRHNDVHDSRQYGIDYKAGVLGGAIYGNRIWNIDRHAIYVDSGRNTVRDIDIYNNEMWACNNGIVLAREADENENDPNVAMDQSLININVYNNIIYDMNLLGLYCQRHSGDSPDGEITNVHISFNTVLDCNQDGSGNDVRFAGWADDDFIDAGIVSQFQCVGNLVYNGKRPIGVVNEFLGQPGFAFHDNFWNGLDPHFTDSAARPPVLTLRSDSPAGNSVGLAHVVPPFEQTAAGIDRAAALTPGAL